VNYEMNRYKVLLYQRPDPDEFHWSEMELYGFLGTRLGSVDAIAEADEKGVAERTITYPLGNTARVVISLEGS
jgi:hypothetical protein